jgi:predicted phosphate transport protein (TIGR00153 family)
MGLLSNVFGKSPFAQLAQHTQKVHECVKLLRPLAEALLAEDYGKILELHHQISATEHEADQIKDEIRRNLAKVFMLSVGKYEVSRFLAFQDDVADGTEDFAVVLRLRKTRIHPELHEDFLALVDQVIRVSELLLNIAEQLTIVAETGFTGKEATAIIETVRQIGEEEWKADKLQRHFAEHYYSIEEKIDPTTLRFYDKFCETLGGIANAAEKTAKYLRQTIASH